MRRVIVTLVISVIFFASGVAARIGDNGGLEEEKCKIYQRIIAPKIAQNTEGELMKSKSFQLNTQEGF